VSSRLEIRVALRLRKFRSSRKFQLSKKTVQHAEGEGKQLVRSEQHEGDGILHYLPTSVTCSNDIRNLFLLEHHA